MHRLKAGTAIESMKSLHLNAIIFASDGHDMFGAISKPHQFGLLSTFIYLNLYPCCMIFLIEIFSFTLIRI